MDTPSKTSTPTFANIYNGLKAALSEGEKRDREIASQMDSLAKEQAKVRADNERARNGLAAMSENGKAAAKPAAKAVKAAKAPQTAAKPAPAAKKAAKGQKKAAAKPVAKKAAAKAAPKTAPKPAQKAAPKKPAAKAAAAKAAPKAKKTAPAKKAAAGKANTSNAAEGRRAVARGDRPPMKEAMATVMGKQTMGSSDVVAGLEKKGWLPNAEDPQQYVSFMLSSNKDVFERVERGQYKVRDGVEFGRKKAAKTAAPKQAAAPKANNSSAKKSTDDELKDLGIGKGNVASNPFSG